MLDGEILWNCYLMLLCYVYILVVILTSGGIGRLFNVSVKASRKFLHMMIGNLVFAIPFFTSEIFPVLVAAPFVLVTFLVSPYSPFPNIGRKLKGLAGITEEGHRLGLLFYSISYTILALIFAARPYVIAAGILPMAYGDAAASIVGEKYGRRGFRVFTSKSLEGSAAMFLASFLILLVGLTFFSGFYSSSIYAEISAAFVVGAMATLVECISPLGLDNLFVPFSGVLVFLALSGGI